MKYKKAAIAGTFDRLHQGHKHFISGAFDIAEIVLIGLTSDKFANEKRADTTGIVVPRIKSFEERKRELMAFLKEKDVQNRAEIIEINDVYGPILNRNDIDILAITAETKRGGENVNRKRREHGLKELPLIEIPLLNAEDNIRISSTRIRLGEIDRFGKVYARSAYFGRKIEDALRQKLKKPLGKLISGTTAEIEKETRNFIKESQPVMIISVGDEATKYLNNWHISPDISVVDFFIKRKRVHESLEELNFPAEFYKADYKDKVIEADNPPGHITSEVAVDLIKVLKEFIKDGKRRVIKVMGEEDLAGIPAILLAPLESVIFYGQPGYQSASGKQTEGIVAVLVTEEKKKEIYNLKELDT